jgi:hypothetical protein
MDNRINLTIVSIICLLLIIGNPSIYSADFKVKTIEGKSRVIGTHPKMIYQFITEDGFYFIENNLNEELDKLRQYRLKITGIFQKRICKIITYDLADNECKGKKPNCKKFIGRVYNTGDEYYLVTRDQTVLKITGSNLAYFNRKKVLLKGKLQSIKPNKGILKVAGFIIISQ